MVYFVMFDLLFSYCDGYNKCQTVKKPFTILSL